MTEKYKTEPEFSSSSSSISKCQSSLTIHQILRQMTIQHGTTTNTPMLNNNNITTDKSPSRFSYLIQPTTPCVFGTEDYDDKSVNDDEFFVTAGGIVHSCPNIYELSIENESEHRKLQSCEHFMFIYKQTTSINNNLNTYDTKVDRYSIVPRFQPMSSALSIDSINSEIESYRERHAIGLCRKGVHTISSFLPNTWKSDNYLLFMPLLNHHFSLSTSVDGIKRSRSYDSSIGQTFSSIFV